ncbi:MAG: hypothetical protein AAGG01_24320 [Planctomycetota bacterium]
MNIDDLKSIVQLGQSVEIEDLEIDIEGDGWKVHGRLGVLRIQSKTEVGSTQEGDLEVRTGAGDVDAARGPRSSRPRPGKAAKAKQIGGGGA